MISVIIVTRNSAGSVQRCLTSLPAAAAASLFEVIVVDAQSTDNTHAVVRGSPLAPKLLVTENKGFSQAANRGAAVAAGEFLFFLNPDAELPPGSLEHLARVCSPPNIAGVSGLLVNRHGRLEPAGEPFPAFAWYVRRRLPWTRQIALGRPFSVPWLSGAALLVRATAFRAAGGFRGSFFLYYEDIDLSRRLRAAGGVLLIDPGMHIRHAGGHSARLWRRLRASDAAEDLYFSLHRPRWEQTALQVVRFLLRPPSSVLWLIMAAVAGVIIARVADLRTAISLSVLASVVPMSARSPEAGVAALLLSVVPGQLVRVPLPFVGSVTATDVLLPLVLCGWACALARQGNCAGSREVSGARRMENHRARPRVLLLSVALLLTAVLPGILLAVERLPLSDWAGAAGYAVRLGFILSVAPLCAFLLRRPERVPVWVVVVATLVTLLGFLQLVVVPDLAPGARCLLPAALCPGPGWDPHPGRLFSTWLDPNLLGGLLVLALAVLLVIPVSLSRPHGLLAIAAGVLLTIGIVLTKSRTSLAALVGVVLLSLFLVRTRRPWPLLSLLGVALMLMPPFAERLWSWNLSDPTTSLRLTSWGQAVAHFTRAPIFGLGYNTYGFAQLSAGNIRSLEIHSRAAADNSLLTFLATTGLFGFGVILLLLTGVFWFLTRRARNAAPSRAWLSAAALLALVGLVIHSQFVHSLVYIHLAVPLALLLGAALSPARATEDSSSACAEQ